MPREKNFDRPPSQEMTPGTERKTLSPDLVVGGAIAVGAVAAVLLPVSLIEKRAGGPIGRKMIAKGKDALRAAKSAAIAEMRSVPLSAEAASAQASRVVERVVEETLAL